MKVELKTSMATKDENWKHGDIVELEDHIALRLINSGQAVLIPEEPVEIERSTPKYRKRRRTATRRYKEVD